MNSNELEKSNTGVLVFAFNTATVDYVALADKTSQLTSKNLGLPITLVTDIDAKPTFNYDRVIRIESTSGNFRTDKGEIKEWRNFGRYLAYQLSPYDTTILLDGDYLVLDKSLLKLLDQTFDYRLMHNSHNPKEQLYQKMGHIGLPFVWATVVLFKKNTRSEQYFNLIGKIQRNYSYYKSLFGCDGSYRNDYAFAIANLIINGYSFEQQKSIPWSMLTIEQPIENIEVKNNFMIFKYPNRADVLPLQNVHVMDKHFLLSEKFSVFVDKVVNESA